MQAQGKGKSGELLQLSFDKGGIQPWSSSTAAIAMVGSGAETPSRTARRQEEWPPTLKGALRHGRGAAEAQAYEPSAAEEEEER